MNFGRFEQNSMDLNQVVSQYVGLSKPIRQIRTDKSETAESTTLSQSHQPGNEANINLTGSV